MLPASNLNDESFPVDPETVRALCEEAVAEQLSAVGRYIIHRRRIPDYYLRQELRAEGIDREQADKMMPTRWITEQGRITLSDQDLKILALLIFLRIHRRLLHHPIDETYPQARSRLRDKLLELMEQRLTRNVLAEHLEVGSKTINSFLRFNPSRSSPTKHCPWEVLDKIAIIDWSTAARARQQPQARATPDSITEGEIQRQARRRHEAEHKGLFRPRTYITPGSACPRCQAGWPTLRLDRDQFDPTERRFTCRSCGHDCYIKMTNITAGANHNTETAS